ncbi:MAG: hypothetical protein AAB348_03915 [Patescibacteria group bacterium]
MFDEPKIPSQPPKNLPTEPADMFEGVDKGGQPAPQIPDALSAGLLKKKEMAPQKMENDLGAILQSNASRADSPIVGKVIFFVFLAMVLGAVGFGGWYFYTGMVKDSKPEVVKPSQETTQPKESAPSASSQPNSDEKASELPAKINNDKILFGEPIDVDKDGLDDAREKEAGTDPNVADTDADGLNDGDELIIWRTDPINPDSDGDTYLDGKEVKNGYNPLGLGKLFQAPTQTTTP